MTRPRLFRLPIERRTLKQVKAYIGPVTYRAFMLWCREKEVRPTDIIRSVVMAWLQQDAGLLKILDKYEPSNAVEE
jgi:hypothetical protein